MRAMAEAERTSSQASWSPSRFVLLPENRSAVLAVRRLTRSLSPVRRRCPFVPLLLHGRPGSGKSHLADELLEWAAFHGSVLRQEAADWATADDPLTTESRDADLLIVEDLQHLPGRSAACF